MPTLLRFLILTLLLGNEFVAIHSELTTDVSISKLLESILFEETTAEASNYETSPVNEYLTSSGIDETTTDNITPLMKDGNATNKSNLNDTNDDVKVISTEKSYNFSSSTFNVTIFTNSSSVTFKEISDHSDHVSVQYESLLKENNFEENHVTYSVQNSSSKKWLPDISKSSTIQPLHSPINIKANLPPQKMENVIKVSSDLKYIYQVQTLDGQENITTKLAHPCNRPCFSGDQPLDCYYQFDVEWYFAMSKACYNCPHNVSDCFLPDCVPADGVPRSVLVINRALPGPSIEVCKGDRIIVDLSNKLGEESTSIHWHGIHQKGTPYMDGVPYVAQCPIPPKSSFRYSFIAETPGTHFWHSHTGHQRADGAFGALIVHVPKEEDPHSSLYDFDLNEHIIQILDWGHELGIEKFLEHHHAGGDNKPKTILVNGHGRLQENNKDSTMPTASFTVQQGFRYRFRVINNGFLNCPIEVSFDHHNLLIISSDGKDLHPIEASSLVTYAGERFDFILEANQTIGNYWIRFQGLMDCDERFTSAHQVAVLHYQDALHEYPTGEITYEAGKRVGLQINALNVNPGTFEKMTIPELTALSSYDESLKQIPDMKVFLSYDFYVIDNPSFHRPPYYTINKVSRNKQLYTPQLNHITLKLPPFPMMSQRDLLDLNSFCNASSVSGCETDFCECLHVITVPLGAVVEIILVDEGVTYDANHPFHLHGYSFRVVAMQKIGDSTTLQAVKDLDNAGKIKRKLKGAPLKDTVTVPDGGFTAIRVHATNPGYWILHCHIEFHVELGMAVIFKVGNHEDFLPIPRSFPTCNNHFHDLGSVDSVTDNAVESGIKTFQLSEHHTQSSAIRWNYTFYYLFISILALR